MKDPLSSEREYGSPPEEYPVLHEADKTAAQERFGFSVREDRKAEEYPPPGPEMIEPGTYRRASDENEKKSVFMRGAMMLASVFILLFFVFNLFGRAANIPADADTEPGPETVEPAEGDDQGPDAEPPDDGTEEPEPEPEPSVTPSCEIVAYGFSSEILGTILFSDMDDVTSVTLEIWDPLTNSMETSVDITEEALNEGSFRFGPFYTDFIYENHLEEYEAAGQFPMQVDVHVVMETGGEEMTFTQLSSMEQGWYVEYTSASVQSDSSYVFPGYISLRTYDNTEDITFLVNRPEEVAPGVMSISVAVDGDLLPESDFDISTRVTEGYFADGTTATVYLKTILIRPPSGYTEGAGHTATVTVTQYLNGYKRNWDTVLELELE